MFRENAVSIYLNLNKVYCVHYYPTKIRLLIILILISLIPGNRITALLLLSSKTHALVDLSVSLTNRTISSRNPFSSPFPSTPTHSNSLYEIHRNAPAVAPTPAPTPAPTTSRGPIVPLSSFPVPAPSRVFIPFAIIGVLAILIAACFYLAYYWANRSGECEIPF